MSRIVKIVIAVVVALLCVASMGVLAMRDASQRPEYCNTCHVVQPYYETWAEGELLAHQHAVAAVPCQRCHPQGMQDTLQENVVNLQEGGSIVITASQWSDEECLACHGDTATLAERTQSLDPNPHAMPHVGEELECAQCHKMHEPSQDPCIECHTDVEVGPGWTTEAMQTLDIQVWSPDVDCAACHSMAPYVESLQDTNLLAYAHAQERLSCTDCHTDEAALQQAHEEAVPGTPVETLRVSMRDCFACHVANQHTNYEEVIVRTTDYVIDGQNINPHAPHPSTAGVPQIECSECHKMHEDSPLIDGCYGCHHTGTVESCGACHEPSFYRTY
jgi:cytochrome c nitrite reductase small subunit